MTRIASRRPSVSRAGHRKEFALPLDTHDMRLFVIIVEAGGFAAARTELNLSLSTISSHVAALESRLNPTLCRRGRAGFKLTDDGRAVHDEVKALFGRIEQSTPGCAA